MVIHQAAAFASSLENDTIHAQAALLVNICMTDGLITKLVFVIYARTSFLLGGGYLVHID